MNHNNYLARNLESYRVLNNFSMRQFATILDMPISTLRTIMKEGNTTMDTALHISNQLNISLDVLVGSEKPEFGLPEYPAEQTTTHTTALCRSRIENAGCLLNGFPSEKRKEIADLIAEIWNVIDK